MCTDYEGPDIKQKTEFDRRNKMEMFGYVPRARIRPTDPAPIIVDFDGKWTNREMRWGWAMWDKSTLVNARSETITELKTFKPHLEQRCLLLASSFNEGGAQFHQAGQIAFCIAGLWREEDGNPRFVMLTTMPNESVAPYHDRMPFLLRDDQLNDWLGTNWQQALAHPDKRALEKFEKQPRLL